MKRVGLFFIVMIVGLMVVLVYNKLVVIEVTDELIRRVYEVLIRMSLITHA